MEKNNYEALVRGCEQCPKQPCETFRNMFLEPMRLCQYHNAFHVAKQDMLKAREKVIKHDDSRVILALVNTGGRQ